MENIKETKKNNLVELKNYKIRKNVKQLTSPQQARREDGQLHPI